MNAKEHASAGQAMLALDAEHGTSQMSWPILPIAVRVKKQDFPAVWLPVIVLWPLFIAFFCLALPLCAALSTPRRNVMAALGATYQMLCALHGTQVEVTDSEHGTWAISLY
jgi:apolipoprotein N-acyltransferase